MFIVLFEVQPHATQFQQYLDFARLLRPELERVEGFIDNERFTSTRTPGRILSLSTWRDEKALIRWRTHAQHHAIQEQGRSAVFADYRLRVGEVTDDTASPGRQAVRQQRFDTTEVGVAKAILLREVAAPAGRMSGSDALTAATTMDPPHPAAVPAGWVDMVDRECFAGILDPAKMVVLTGWRTEEAARAWHTAAIARVDQPGAGRSRLVRVIRAYGMFDRREAPQYYPQARPTAATLPW